MLFAIDPGLVSTASTRKTELFAMAPALDFVQYESHHWCRQSGLKCTRDLTDLVDRRVCAFTELLQLNIVPTHISSDSVWMGMRLIGDRR